MLAVAADEVELQDVLEGTVRLGCLGGIGEDLLDVRLVRAACGGEEFQSVAVVWEVARRNHDRAVRCRVLKDGRHEHGGGGGEDAVDAVCARVGESREDAVLDGERGDARVVADGDLQLCGALARRFAEETDEAGGDAVCRLGGEGDRLIGHAGNGDATDVAAVREFFEVVIGQGHRGSSFVYDCVFVGGYACNDSNVDSYTPPPKHLACKRSCACTLKESLIK